jgi:threonine dehydrogenase-like Zn-dependent dehydrogenase
MSLSPLTGGSHLQYKLSRFVSLCRLPPVVGRYRSQNHISIQNTSFASLSRNRETPVAIDLLASGTMDLGWIVTHRFALDDFKQALHLLKKRGQHGAIKGVFAFA